MPQKLVEFAVEQYARPEIAKACLQLQETASADVNMLLAAAWLATQRLQWTADDVQQLISECENWRKHCILPLRAVRLHLKGHALYEQVKALELEAELKQLEQIARLLATFTLSKNQQSMQIILEMNLRIYFEKIIGNPTTSIAYQFFLEKFSTS